MKKINILTKSVYNKIAAGEVVDKPYSVVKELVENSVDAAATEIEICIERGGKQLIKVVDNGTGIERDDMRAAFFPHATSKISNAEDIERISTLGFRGEALASISAVSKVELISVTQGNSACKVKCVDGNVGAVEPAAFEKGTEICVSELFYNVPARAKYLREDKKEETEITNLVTRFILGNPKIAFRYFVDGKLVMHSDGEGFDEAVAQVYGAKTIAKCHKINVDEHGLKIYGFISGQNFFKPNKTYQSVFLNGRYVINATIAAAVTRAYATYAMKRQYPFYVLNVDVPRQHVDVNVHPNKMDVRLLNAHSVFSLIYGAISNILDGTASAAKFVTESAKTSEITSAKPSNIFSFGERSVFYGAKPSGEKQGGGQPRKYYDPYAEELFVDADPNENKDNYIFVSNDSIPSGLNRDPRIDEAYRRRLYEQQMIEYESCKYKGNLFNTYLLYEVCDTVYIIDQHAAHERLIYDRLREKISERKIERQILLEPYLFGTNPQETEFIEKNIRIIRSLGFDLKPFGTNAYKVDEVPMDLQYINTEEFFNELLADLKNLSGIKLEDILKDRIAMTACKHAVKGGKELTDDEVTLLFKMLKGNVGLKCPHGRPICVALDKKDLEKMFKRIV